MMSPEAALRSDHVNLLIHRYLQESGFENAAKALHVDWQRQSEYRDPEALPFAHTLQRNELISVIQAGLHYDDLRARAGKTDRKFRWTNERGRIDGYGENGASSRPSSSGRRKGQPSVVRASDDFPTPMPKRQRRGEGSETQVNGERDGVNDDGVDADGDVDAEGEDDADVASPAVPWEPETVPAERYDSVMTQTEFKVVPKTSTLSWTIDKPDAKLLEGSWNLGPEARHARTFLAVGDSLCRLYEIPDSMDDPLQIKSLDEPIVSDDAAVTAVAWRPDGEAATFALDVSPASAERSQMISLSVIERSRDGSSAVFLAAPPVLEPAPIVLSLRYSPSGEYLVAAKTNTKRGLVQVWRTARTPDTEVQTVHEPIAWRMFETPIHDILWSGHDTFAVCGDAGSSHLYQIDGSQQEATEVQTIEIHGLVALNSNVLPAEHAWDHIRIDRSHRISAFASIDARQIILTSRIHSSGLPSETDFKIDVTGEITALELQPTHTAANSDAVEAESQSPSLLAAATDEGPCNIYIASRQADGTITCTDGPSLPLLEGQILTLAWSTRGDYLAIGNTDVVQIWHASSLKRTDGAVNPSPDAYVTWRPAMETGVLQNEQHEEERELYQPSLSWSSDDSLAYAAEKQIAILRFKLQQPETNGQSSPQR